MNNEITSLLFHKKHKDKTRVLASPLRNFKTNKMSIDLALSRNRSTNMSISQLMINHPKRFQFPLLSCSLCNYVLTVCLTSNIFLINA